MVGEREITIKTGLGQRLFWSHLVVALVGFILVLGSFIFSVWEGRQSKLLLESVKPSLRGHYINIQTGLDESVSLVFQGLTISTNELIPQWHSIWESLIWNSVNNLNAEIGNKKSKSNAVKANREDRRMFDQLEVSLARLEELQWYVIDLRESPGNYPAKMVLIKNIRPLSEKINLGLDTLIKQQSYQESTFDTFRIMADLRASYLRSIGLLERYIDGGQERLKDEMLAQETITRSLFDELADVKTLNNSSSDLLRWLAIKCDLLYGYVSQAIELRQNPQWDISRDVIISQILPERHRADSLIDILMKRQAELIERNSETLFHNKQLYILAGPVLLLILVASAYLIARQRTKNLMQPIAQLVNATKALSEDRFMHKLQIERKDELGTLAQSFNFMVDVLREKREQLRALATTDGLTQLLNRHAFNELIEKEWRRSLREQQPMTVIIMDVDCFKQYNDTYGHMAGDHALVKVAEAIRTASKRPNDMAVRFGGEEFVLLLPGTSEYGALNVAKNVQSNLASMAVAHEKNPGVGILSLSMGIASIVPTKKQTWESLMKMADEALYQAKENGRNRIVFHSETMCQVEMS